MEIYRKGIPIGYLDTDAELAANSDVKIASQKAIKAYADAINSSLSTTIAEAVITGGATFLSVASYAGNIQDTLDAAAALGDTTKGAVVYIPPGDYTTTGLTYAPYVSIIGAGLATRITMTGATGSVIGPHLPAVATTHNWFANFYIDMDNQGDTGLMLEAMQNASVFNIKVFNVPDGTYTYNSLPMKRAGITLLGKASISGAYYNTLNNCQVQGTSTTDRGACGIYLFGTASQPANFNKINLPKIFYCTTGIEVAVGGDNIIDMPEVSLCDVGILFSGSGQRNEARKIYAENMEVIPCQVDASAYYSKIGPFASVTTTSSIVKELFMSSQTGDFEVGDTVTATGGKSAVVIAINGGTGAQSLVCNAIVGSFVATNEISSVVGGAGVLSAAPVARFSKELLLTASVAFQDGDVISVTGKNINGTVYGIPQSYNDGQITSIIVKNITGGVNAAAQFAVGDVLDCDRLGADVATVKAIATPLLADQVALARARTLLDDGSIFAARNFMFGLRGLLFSHSAIDAAWDAMIDFDGAAGTGKTLQFRSNNAANAMTKRFELSSGANAATLTFSNSTSVALEGTWNGGHLLLGSYHLWVDETGDLRIKSSAPSAHDDGTVVGSQT